MESIIPAILLQIIIIPLIAAVACALLGKRLKRKTGWIAVVATLCSTALLAYVAVQMWLQGGTLVETYTWGTIVFQLDLGFFADGLSIPVALAMSIICTAMSVYSINYMDHRIDHLYGKEKPETYALYYSLFLLFPVGLLGGALSTNTIELFLFLESGLIPFYVLMDVFGYNDRHHIAMMSFIWTQAGAVVYLIGAVMAGVNAGSFAITSLATLSDPALGLLVCGLILVGFLVKMATFGFHVWLPLVHAEHPTSIAAVLATIVGFGTYMIARLLYQNMFASFQLFSLPLMILAIVTMIYGAYLTIGQNDVKRLFACSTIGQTSYSILGLAAMNAMGVEGAVFYFISHIIGKAILFSVAGILVTQTGTRNIKEMGGLAQKMPLTATLCIIGAMILSAIPPLGGFQAEWILFAGVFTQGLTSTVFLVVAIIGLFATFLTAAYTFLPAIRIFFGPISTENSQKVKEAPWTMTAPLCVLAVLSVLIGLFPDVIMHFLTSAF
jgi:formate hydrogenlyase subunit 3/multisubunit Na+/H+ antiporter MnhD subunit